MPGPYPLANLGVTIDANGAAAPTFEDILQSFIAAYQQVYGSDLYLGADSQDFQWLAVQSQIVHDTNQAVIAAYFSYSPTFAQGIGLSSVVKINGIARLAPSTSTATVTLVGQAGTTINNGAVADVFDNAWDLPAQVIIPPSGEIEVTAIARDPGALRAEPGTITRMLTLVPGWQSVTNLIAAQPGRPLESDAALRRRQTVSVSLPAITPRLAILGAVANIPGVGQVQVYDNDTDSVDENGIPAHSIAVVVEGGDALAIATQILFKKNVGCGTYGDIEVRVFDPNGVPQTINFFYVDHVEIFVTVVIRPLIGYQNSTANLIRASIVQYITHLTIGENIYNSWLYAPANLAGDAAIEATGLDQLALERLSETYVIQRILTGTVDNPNSEADVPISFTAATTATMTGVLVQLAPTTTP
jgi:uncharacterized phage protein gp47/JayE